MVAQTAIQLTPAPTGPSTSLTGEPLAIDVTGGGPTGMTLALTLLSYGVRAQIRVFDPRWRQDGDRIVWRDLEYGNRRREQIVTLQSNVWHGLPREVQRSLFDRHEYSEVWPYSADSPEERGLPRNLPIRDLEDRLLELLQNRPGVVLVPERYDPGRMAGRQILAICEGANSETREHFITKFGRPQSDLYQLNGEPLEETILGMQVETGAPAGEGVLITAAQNRYLLNTHHGRGFLNMRLTREEASELAGLGPAGPADCPLGQSCVLLRFRSLYRCAVHDTVFRPCVDQRSNLWPRIREGLRLFGIDEDSLLAIRAFRCSLVHRPRFVAELARGTWGCLLGDAANAMHFWPGRGLNTGLKSALSLARCLARRWRGGQLRASDLCEHEGVMQMLQAREVDNRAWRTMLMCDEHGNPRPIQERIARGLRGPCDRVALTNELLARMRSIRARLASRMGALPNDHVLAGRLAALSDLTLKILVETGPWISAEVGGPEVDVDAILPLPQPPRIGVAGVGPRLWDEAKRSDPGKRSPATAAREHRDDPVTLALQMPAVRRPDRCHSSAA